MKEQKNSFYGLPDLSKYSNTKYEKERARLETDGFFVLDRVFTPELLSEAIIRLDEINKTQSEEIGGIENLKAIKEENTLRVPFLYDEFFLKFFTEPRVLEILKSVYCREFILLTQSGLINEPRKDHTGARWHKDLPYQHYASKQPVCINVLVVLTDFTPETGSTCFIKGSHQNIDVPNEKEIEENFFQVNASAGSVIVFNSLTLHKMGQNISKYSRYAINHMFGTPIFKQHMNFHLMSNNKYKDDPILSRLLDYPYSVPESVLSFRQKKLRNIKKADND